MFFLAWTPTVCDWHSGLSHSFSTLYAPFSSWNLLSDSEIFELCIVVPCVIWFLMSSNVFNIMHKHATECDSDVRSLLFLFLVCHLVFITFQMRQWTFRKKKKKTEEKKKNKRWFQFNTVIQHVLIRSLRQTHRIVLVLI